MKAEYLKENHRALYLDLLLSGKLNEYLYRTDEECYQMMELLVEQMKASEGVIEELKATDQMAWLGAMNSIRNRAEEIIINELIYS